MRPAAILAVAAGGAVGAVLRWALTALAPDLGATLAINVSGTLLLACLPALALVRRRPVLAAGLGPGLCGGYTTLSAYSEQARALLADGRTALAGAYLLGTLAGCLLAAALGARLVRRRAR